MRSLLSRASIGLPILAAIVSLAGAAQATSTGDGAWEWQNPKPCGNWLEAVCFVDPLNGWVAGLRGTILRTTDGGVTWHGQTSGTKSDLFGIHFCDSQHGWAVGYDRFTGEHPIILHTSNGGATWHPQNPRVNVPLNAVHAENKGTAWAVGNEGTIIYTLDGGANWWRDFSGTTASLRSVWWPDAEHGWAVGDNGTILHRVPPAEMWFRQNSEVTDELDGVCFVDNECGWAVGPNNMILHTANGGQKWVRQSVPGGYGFRSVSFIDRLRGWAVGDWETIFWTNDGGANWYPSECPIGGAYLRSVSGVPGPDPMTARAWAVGYCGPWDEQAASPAQEFNPLPCVIINTPDGVNWNQQSFGFFWGLAGVDFVDTQKGWAVGGGTLAWTLDGGTDWHCIHWLGMEFLQDVDFVDDLYGWLCGSDADGGLVWHTQDGGQHWIAQWPNTPSWLYGICFVDRLNGWTCGMDGTIRHTNSGGSIWEPQTSGTTAWLKSIHFVDREYGWCVGCHYGSQEGVILATRNGGQTWLPQQAQGLANLPRLEDVWFIDRSNGWAVGWGNDAGWILHTTDGGQTWTAERHPNTMFFQVRAADARNVWVLSGDYVLATANGGHCWVRQELGNQDQMGGMSFPTTEQGWVVGGGILHTSTGGFGTCRGMKAISDFHPVKTQNVVVTAVLENEFYVQQPDRSSGILVRGLPEILLSEGDVLATLTGTTGRTADDERCVVLDALTVAAPLAEFPAPLGMPNRAVGGGGFCYDPSSPGPPPTGQRGVDEGFGLNNIGLLGRTWGRVIDVDPREWPEWMIIDDNFMQPYTRVRVIIPQPGTLVPGQDQYVVVTGPISCYLDRASGTLKRAIKVRRQEDIVTL